jgi:hypothetical protein
MRKIFLSLVFILALLLPVPVFATCHAVGPSSTGGGTGADWNDMETLPTTLARGDIYYLADGVYGNHLTISGTSGSTGSAELRKAQSYDYGSTCSPSIGAGWSTGTMGSAQAIWRSTGSGQIIGAIPANITFNGNGNNAGTSEVGCGGVDANPAPSQSDYMSATYGQTPSACGILIDDSTCTSTATDGCDGGSGVIKGGGANIVWESVEWFGQGLNSNGNNNSETYFWFANGGTLTNVTLSHNYFHNASTTYFTIVTGGWNGGSFDHNYVWGVYDGSVNHGEAIQFQGSNGSSGTPDYIHHNLFRDQQTNGDVVGVSTGNQDHIYLYANADICSSGGTSTTCRHNDGWIGCFQSGNNCVATNYFVFNNTLAFPANCGSVINSGSSLTYNNNLYYGCSGSSNGGGATYTQDYNTYLNSGSGDGGAHSVAVTSGAANPFTNVNLGVQLSAESSNYNNRLTTSYGVPNEGVDLYGNAYTTDRGAAQYNGSAPGAPTQVYGVVVQGVIIY